MQQYDQQQYDYTQQGYNQAAYDTGQWDAQHGYNQAAYDTGQWGVQQDYQYSYNEQNYQNYQTNNVSPVAYEPPPLPELSAAPPPPPPPRRDLEKAKQPSEDSTKQQQETVPQWTDLPAHTEQYSDMMFDASCDVGTEGFEDAWTGTDQTTQALKDAWGAQAQHSLGEVLEEQANVPAQFTTTTNNGKAVESETSDVNSSGSETELDAATKQVSWIRNKCIAMRLSAESATHSSRCLRADTARRRTTRL